MLAVVAVHAATASTAFVAAALLLLLLLLLLVRMHLQVLALPEATFVNSAETFARLEHPLPTCLCCQSRQDMFCYASLLLFKRGKGCRIRSETRRL